MGLNDDVRTHRSLISHKNAAVLFLEVIKTDVSVTANGIL